MFISAGSGARTAQRHGRVHQIAQGVRCDAVSGQTVQHRVHMPIVALCEPVFAGPGFEFQQRILVAIPVDAHVARVQVEYATPPVGCQSHAAVRHVHPIAGGRHGFRHAGRCLQPFIRYGVVTADMDARMGFVIVQATAHPIIGSPPVGFEVPVGGGRIRVGFRPDHTRILQAQIIISAGASGRLVGAGCALGQSGGTV